MIIMRRDPVDIIYGISNFLRSKGIGETFTIAELAEATGHHRVTVEKYMNIISLVHNRVPQVGKDGSKLKVTRLPPDLEKLDETQILLSSLYFKKAFSQKNAVPKELWVRDEVFKRLSERGFIGIKADKVYLTSLGLRSAMLIIRDSIARGIDSDMSKFTEEQPEKEQEAVVIVPYKPWMERRAYPSVSA
ncbi:MAG TPA: hypothetical protein ENH17_04855 [Nitrospirae bacterium]|nr:hypothetical protein [Nitrospirota bacterium]